MGETAQIVALWRRCRAAGEPVALATVVQVEGSSYRKPGARMLVASSGERAGTVSGGCLEMEISRKIWWLTAHGPCVEQYQSSFDEDMLGEAGGVPWGLGCGGTVWVLLERNPSAVLQALADGMEDSRAAVVVAALEGTRVGTRAVFRQPVRAAAHAAAESLELHVPEAFSGSTGTPTLPGELHTAAARAIADQASLAFDADFHPTSERPAYFVEYLAPAPRLSVFGAGDDAQPIAAFAEALGWRVVIADGRSHLLRRERFPQAAELRLLTYAGAASPLACVPGAPAAPLPGVLGNSCAGSLPSGSIARQPGAEPTEPRSISSLLSRDSRLSRDWSAALIPAVIPATHPGTSPGDLAVILTHSFEQDRALLAALLPEPLAYLGILGPRHRTERLLAEVAPALGWTMDDCLRRLRAPVGLDLGARDPASIALAIVAEMQATLTGRQVAVTRAAQLEQVAIPENIRA